MAETQPKAAPAAKPAKKAERKKPVRKAPVQKDYSSKLEWLAALVEYETKQNEVSSAAKVKTIDKRIAAKQALVEKTNTEIAELKAKRAALVPSEETAETEGPEPEDDEAGVPQA